MKNVGGRDRVRGGEGGKRERERRGVHQHMAEHVHVYTYLPFASELTLQN